MLKSKNLKMGTSSKAQFTVTVTTVNVIGQLHQICTMSLPQRPILDFIKHAIFHSNLLKWSYNHYDQTSAPKILAHVDQNIMLYRYFYVIKVNSVEGKLLQFLH